MSSQKRIEYYDLLKGIAIYLVVMGHVLTMCIRGVDASFIFKMIGQVHMPIFFFISGYMTYKPTSDGGWSRPRLCKRFVQLIIPAVVMSALWVWYFPHSHLESPLHDNLPGLYRSYWKDGYWFPLCLMELCVAYWPLSWLLSRLKRVWLQAAVLVLTYAVLVAMSIAWADESGNVDPAGVGLLARYFPVFIMGVLAHRHKDAFGRMWHSEVWLVVAVVVGALSFYAVVYPWDLPWLPVYSPIVLVPVLHACIIVVAHAMVEPWSKREYAPGHTPGRVARFFNYLGTESLGLYLCHFFFLFPLPMLRQPVIYMGMGVVPLAVISCAVAACVIVVTLLAMRLIGCSRVLGTVMLGKPWRK